MPRLTNEAPRLRDSRLGLRTIRIVECLQCPRCGKETGHYPEPTGNGWRLLCRHCQAEIVVAEDEGDASCS